MISSVTMKQFLTPWSLVLLILSMTSCELPQYLAVILEKDHLGYYLEGTKEERQQMRQFLTDLETETDPETSYVLIQQIVRAFHKAGRIDKMNLFLTNHVVKRPDDPFNGYYLFLVAQNYFNEKAYPFAVHYYERILKNHEDLLIQDVSIHYLCLINLTKLINDPASRAEYYKELLSRFNPDQHYTPEPMEVDLGASYYNLARTYEQLGEWDLAMQAYKNFLNYPETVIPGNLNAHAEISQKVAFYERRNKDWTNASLEDLKEKIQWAIYGKNARLLNQYRAKVNFFTRSWEQQDNPEQIDPDSFFSVLGTFMGRRLSFRKDLDASSNNREAYLETFGWSYRIPTWYLYFRKISFPADPELNGQWEWAGIYFGEKPFSGGN